MGVALKDILTKEFLERFQNSFAFATGFGVVFVDLKGNHIGKGSNFSKFCKEINKTPEGAAYCASTNRKAIEIAMQTGKPSIYICHAGLVNIEIPLTFEGKYVGAITAGQVLCSDDEYYPKDREISAIPWLSTEEAKEYFRNIRTLTRKQIEATAVSLENISNYMVQTVMYNKLQEKLVEEQSKRLEYEKKHIEMVHQLKLAELDALQKQVTPHFIFNVINSISRLISLGKYDTAQTILDSFSALLRYSLSDIRSTITLGQELFYIENYLRIQKHRFSDRLDYRISVADGLTGITIPYFSLQPLVENGIEHGLLPLEQGGQLELNCYRRQGLFIIDISDNGIGIDSSQLAKILETLDDSQAFVPSNHVGLRNSYRRMKLMFGDKLGFFIDSEKNAGTKVSIRIREAE